MNSMFICHIYHLLVCPINPCVELNFIASARDCEFVFALAAAAGMFLKCSGPRNCIPHFKWKWLAGAATQRMLEFLDCCCSFRRDCCARRSEQKLSLALGFSHLTLANISQCGWCLWIHARLHGNILLASRQKCATFSLDRVARIMKQLGKLRRV